MSEKISSSFNIKDICQDKNKLTVTLSEILYIISNELINELDFNELKIKNKHVVNTVRKTLYTILTKDNLNKEHIYKLLIVLKNNIKNYPLWTIFGMNVKGTEKIEKLSELYSHARSRHFFSHIYNSKSFKEIKSFLSKELIEYLKFLQKNNIYAKRGLTFQVLTIWFAFSNPKFVAPLSRASITFPIIKSIINNCFNYERVYIDYIDLNNPNKVDKIHMYHEVWLEAFNLARQRLIDELQDNDINVIDIYYLISILRANKMRITYN
ncbi:MAG: hypothetical protein F7C35_03670, partial [Desulfurococcales archaeon]|nr:hypothetical protein [Desulfurococcales archaeon]